MNRRDTIIIAVLINAGLLVVLFATALKPEPAKEKQPIVRQEIEVPAPKLQKLMPPKEIEIPVVAKPAPPKPAPVIEKKPPAPAPIQERKTVVVQAGDALEKIARRHGVSVAHLMEANHLKTTALRVGQELVIPPGGKVVATASKSAPKYYEVRAGDSPWTIASKNKIKLDELLSLNDLDETSAKKIKPGDKLRIE